MRGDVWKTWLGILLAILGFLVVLVLLYAQSAEKARRSLVDAETFCPKPEGKTVWGINHIKPPAMPGGVAIVIDATDSLDSAARESLSIYFDGEEFSNSISDFQRVRVYSLEESVGALEVPSFDLCAPPNKEVSPYLDNPRKRRIEFKEKFVRVLVEIIDELARGKEKSRSPIAEMLGIIAEENERIIVVSDMMEHSPPTCSLYRNGGRHNYATFAAKGCVKSAAQLGETHFDILFLSREKLRGTQNPSLVSFWTTYFKTNDATVTFRPLAIIAVSCNRAEDRPQECEKCLGNDWLENYEYCTRF